MRELKPALANSVVSRIKVMGRMDIAERRVPQDGRATITIGRGSTPSFTPLSQDDDEPRPPTSAARSIDLRISTLPTSYGERAVVRLLESSRGEYLSGFDTLGMPGHVRSAYLERASRASGIVLVTGPTGSGKTTTLYATLRWLASKTMAGAASDVHPRSRLRDCGLNIVTIEDPIEYELSTVGLSISQSQVNTRKGVTFATGLRHILRQDPDIVMVGEIRDAETARTAIQASLTGHMVLSTLHTNDAASAVTRLIDLGVEPYLVSASLAGVLAQRLVRRVHAACAGKGCSEDGHGGRGCFGSGFQGRTGLFELLRVTEPIRELISRTVPVSEIRAEACARGMRTLLEEGRRLISEGITTAAEIARVVHGTGGEE
jgi:general secretion pathway protein E